MSFSRTLAAGKIRVVQTEFEFSAQHVVRERVEGMDDKACGQQVALKQTQAVGTADAGTRQGDGECRCASVGLQFAV